MSSNVSKDFQYFLLVILSLTVFKINKIHFNLQKFILKSMKCYDATEPAIATLSGMRREQKQQAGSQVAFLAAL